MGSLTIRYDDLTKSQTKRVKALIKDGWKCLVHKNDNTVVMYHPGKRSWFQRIYSDSTEIYRPTTQVKE